jgi:Ca-activated chloride channel homolog
MRETTWRTVAAAALLVSLSAACGGGSSAFDGGADLEEPGGCLPIDMLVSSEKVALLADLAAAFNVSDAAEDADGVCGFVRVQTRPSGEAMALLAAGWPNAAQNGPPPGVWSPAANSWATLLNHHLSELGAAPMAPPGEPFMRTPLVIAMPEPMAMALGWPDRQLGWADLVALARDPAGWAAVGEPQWGPFKLGKTNPNFSTSALSATIAQYYAAAGKNAELTVEDLEHAGVEAFVRDLESAVLHYGDTTLTFLNNLYAHDARGAALNYVSAIAIEEKSILDYNAGNPDGIRQPNEQLKPPRVPLVAIYPTEGTLFSDNPFIVLDAPWVDEHQRRIAERFEAFIKRRGAQWRVMRAGFRPGNDSMTLRTPLVPDNGVDPLQPGRILPLPEADVLARMLELWSVHRKSARVLLVVDVSGSMEEQVNPETGATKLDLAKQAVSDALDLFADHDEVGLWVFSTALGPSGSNDWLEIVPLGQMGQGRATLAGAIDGLQSQEYTPLFTVTGAAYNTLLENFDPDRINAVVLLTDGQNEDPRNTNLPRLLQTLRQGAESEAQTPVRVFAIAYGADADLETLRRIAEATSGQVYDASDPRSIATVISAVVSNF